MNPAYYGPLAALLLLAVNLLWFQLRIVPLLEQRKRDSHKSPTSAPESHPKSSE